MTSRELTEWMAYASVEPFGDDRADIREAQTTAMLANIHRDAKKRGPYTIDEFRLFKDVWEPESDPGGEDDAGPDPEQQRRLAEKIKATMLGLGGKR